MNRGIAILLVALVGAGGLYLAFGQHQESASDKFNESLQDFNKSSQEATDSLHDIHQANQQIAQNDAAACKKFGPTVAQQISDQATAQTGTPHRTVDCSAAPPPTPVAPPTTMKEAQDRVSELEAEGKKNTPEWNQAVNAEAGLYVQNHPSP